MYAKGLVIGIILIALLTPLSMGDGVPIMTLSLHSITHENRQIAVIDVHGNSETMHLFLSVVSLDPGKNITVLIPVRTAPSNLTVQNTTESDFYGNNSLTNASRQHERELYGANTTLHNYLLTTTLFTTGSLITPVLGGFAVFFMIAGTGAAGSESSYMNFQTGDSAEIYNFTTLKSVEEFYSKYNMTLPPSVNDTLHRYSSFHLIALHMRTRAPIPEREYMALEEKCPKTMELVRDYVKTHPTVKAKAMLNNIYYLPDFKNVEKTLESEAGDNYTLSQYLWDLMAGIYGYGNMRGIELSVDMPLDNGHAFYPLGTSPAWNSSGEIRV
ncbi:MAG: hypothetical protein GXO25_08610 [Euryarchaeota archaeon]|nr:hypothetical protein [Euryarchaeota archaeon]